MPEGLSNQLHELALARGSLKMRAGFLAGHAVQEMIIHTGECPRLNERANEPF
jgi:hypothetical protein